MSCDILQYYLREFIHVPVQVLNTVAGTNPAVVAVFARALTTFSQLPRVVEDSQDFNLPHASPQALGGTGLYWDWTLDWTLGLDMHGLWMRMVCSR